MLAVKPIKRIVYTAAQLQEKYLDYIAQTPNAKIRKERASRAENMRFVAKMR